MSAKNNIWKALVKWVLPILLVLAGCDKRPDQWDAFIYPNTGDLSVFEKINGFKTFELSQQAAIDRLKSMSGDGDYECGYMCGVNKKLDGLNVCKETRK